MSKVSALYLESFRPAFLCIGHPMCPLSQVGFKNGFNQPPGREDNWDGYIELKKIKGLRRLEVPLIFFCKTN